MHFFLCLIPHVFVSISIKTFPTLQKPLQLLTFNTLIESYSFHEAPKSCKNILLVSIKTYCTILSASIQYPKNLKLFFIILFSNHTVSIPLNIHIQNALQQFYTHILLVFSYNIPSLSLVNTIITITFKCNY